MQLIKQEDVNREIVKNFLWEFTVAKSGLYLLEIVAKAQSWGQNLLNRRSFFNDDDLTVKVNGSEIFPLDGKKGLEKAVWNGNELKGLFKTVLIAINLKAGQNYLDFRADNSPLISSIQISLVEENNQIIYIPTINNPAESGSGRPWLSYALVNLPIKNIKVIARADKNGRDDQDIKIIINRQIQKNTAKKSHRDWYWCGNILRGKDREFNQDFNADNKSNLIELWADKNPSLRRIEISLLPLPVTEENRIPTVAEPQALAVPKGSNSRLAFKNDTEQMILARAIFGEGRSLPDEGKTAIGWSIRNRVEDERWADNYKEVILQAGQYDAFKENDRNYPYVFDPFYKVDPKQRDAWQKSYEIAGQVIRGEILDPTDGANHYYSIPIETIPYWRDAKEAEFKIQIVNVLFYDLHRAGEGGFIKISLLILALVLVFIFGALLTARAIISSQDLSENNSPQPSREFAHYFINPATSEIEAIYFNKSGELTGRKQLTDDGYGKIKLRVSSSLGDGNSYQSDRQDLSNLIYYQYLHKSLWDFDQGSEQASGDYKQNYLALMIKDGEDGLPKRVYLGDYRTSDWEWNGDGTVTVYSSCGTHCRYYRRINIADGKILEEDQVYKD